MYNSARLALQVAAQQRGSIMEIPREMRQTPLGPQKYPGPY